MNRLAMGLAVGAGYVLGRTKKAKFAFAVGTMVAGKRLNLSPKALGSLVTQQLENNPQFKEIGDQLREDLRGVGKAATGSLLNRQLEGLADRLHDRTLDVQDRISGVAPDDVKDVGRDDEDDADDADAPRDEDERDEDEDDAESEPAGRGRKTAAKRPSKPAAKKTAAKKTARKTVPKQAGRSRAAQSKTGQSKTAESKTGQSKAAQSKTAQKKSASAARGGARKTASASRTGGGRAKGGDRG
ncbi:hypothetical protein [Streptomyces sp. NRRL S-920]|uniref:hypothetical protein n=1 Tax=Streptomyces sp. NRRL S-920 TaxID=1463921 RepID=UPI0004C8344C|nr:hypothetical protein [Streptomyces sp. NRRL S-920]